MHNHAHSHLLDTAFGVSFDIFNPSKDDIRLEDIGLALANQCRFNGHVSRFYSVAEHCVVASLRCDPRHALHVLLHDAAEAYIGDIARPIKRLFAGIETIEERILAEIYLALGINCPSLEARAEIEVADLRMLATEKRQLLPNSGEWPVLDGVDPYFENGKPLRLSCWSQELAMILFSQRLYELL